MAQHQEQGQAQHVSITNTVPAEVSPHATTATWHPVEKTSLRFLDLPAELRNMIYKLVTAGINPDLVKDKDGTVLATAPLARVNRQIRDEVLPLLEARSHAAIAKLTKNFHFTDVIACFASANTPFCTIERLCLGMDMAMLLGRDPLKFLLRRKLSKPIGP